MFSRPAKVDSNQSEIVKGLRKVGASVVHLHMVGSGVPDLLVGFRGENFLIEIKTEKGRLTKYQKDLFAKWRGATIHIVRTIEDALKVIGVYS